MTDHVLLIVLLVLMVISLGIQLLGLTRGRR